MKTRWKIAMVLAALGVVCAVILFRPGASVKAAVEQTRKELRAQGFKADLSDFGSGYAYEMHERVMAMRLTSSLGLPGTRGVPSFGELMTPAGEHGAVVVWKQAKPFNPGGNQYAYKFDAEAADDPWLIMRAALEGRRDEADTAAAAALSGPLRFDLDFSAGARMLLPHLMGLRLLSEMFATRTILALHDGDRDAAWTNLLAATRLVTAWEMEPVEISQNVRCRDMQTFYNLTWQALQAANWADERLAELQREWEGLDLFKSLPDTVALTGAQDVEAVRTERAASATASTPMPNPFQYPGKAFDAVVERWQRKRYLSHGSYVDEKDMLLFYRDRVKEVRRAMASQTWAEMRGQPGVTNVNLFESRYKNRFSTAQAIMRTRQIALKLNGSATGSAATLAGRLVEAEARRRVLIAAIALERFRGRHGAYPGSLGELAPDFLKVVPVDFMDGKPLRYVRTEDGHFYLYSVGLSCVDDGGKMPTEESVRMPRLMLRRGGNVPVAGSVVWPEAAK